MASVYLKDYREELKRVGEAVFKQRYRSPMLIVTGRTGELLDDSQSEDKTMIATPSAKPPEAMALLHRVFAVAKAAHAQRGPIVLGRSGQNDIAIPEYSISKRHCYFEFAQDGTKVADCGSTNGTILGDAKLAPREPVPIRDGSTLSLGRFVFSFRTAVGFLAHVKSLAH
jgi:FHA domain